MSSVCIADLPSLITPPSGDGWREIPHVTKIAKVFFPPRRRGARWPRTANARVFGTRPRPSRSSLRSSGSRQLLADQVVVEALVCHQLLVAAALDQTPLLEHQDHVGI